jgi:hypothetical protein
MVQALQEQNRALQEQLNQTSRHSSRPPSRDPPSSPRPKRPRSKRRRGGQPGHPGQTRTLIPVEDVDEVVPLKPEPCQGCQAPLSGDDPAPFRQSPSDRDSADRAGDHRVPMASVEVPGGWRDDAPSPGPRAFPVAPMAPASMPRWRCVAGRIACPSARLSR